MRFFRNINKSIDRVINRKEDVIGACFSAKDADDMNPRELTREERKAAIIDILEHEKCDAILLDAHILQHKKYKEPSSYAKNDAILLDGHLLQPKGQ